MTLGHTSSGSERAEQGNSSITRFRTLAKRAAPHSASVQRTHDGLWEWEDPLGKRRHRRPLQSFISTSARVRPPLELPMAAPRHGERSSHHEIVSSIDQSLKGEKREYGEARNVPAAPSCGAKTDSTASKRIEWPETRRWVRPPLLSVDLFSELIAYQPVDWAIGPLGHGVANLH